MALHSGKTTCKETFYLAELCTLGHFTLPCCPGCRCSAALKSANVSAKEKVHGVLTGAVRSVSKRLAVHSIATPVITLQRVFPHDDAPETRQKIAFRPLPRPGEAPFGASPGPASGNLLGGAAHCRPRCIENWALQANIHRFYKVLPTQYGRKILHTAPGRKARRRAFRRAARPSVWQGIGGGTLPPPMH